MRARLGAARGRSVPALGGERTLDAGRPRHDRLASLEHAYGEATNVPAVPFLYELLTAPGVRDKVGIASLLACIADGRGILESGIANDSEEMLRRMLGRRGRSLEEELAREAAAMRALLQSPVSRGLNSIQLRVLPPPAHEFLVRAELDEAGAVEHDDEVGHAHRRETV